MSSSQSLLQLVPLSLAVKSISLAKVVKTHLQALSLSKATVTITGRTVEAVLMAQAEVNLASPLLEQLTQMLSKILMNYWIRLTEVMKAFTDVKARNCGNPFSLTTMIPTSPARQCKLPY